MKSSVVFSLFAALSLLGLSAGLQAQPNCNGNHITVHAVGGAGQPGNIRVTPMVFNQKKGCDVEIRVPRGMTTNIISQQAGWLNASSSGDSIWISIPEGTANSDYKYDVEIVNFGRFDPHIRVY